MPKPSRIQCAQYRTCLQHRLTEIAGETDECTYLYACERFDCLTYEEKQYVMRGLAHDLHLSVQEVSQHYRNCFSRVKYTEDFTKYHDAVAQRVTELFAQNMLKKDIVTLVKQEYSSYSIFPPSIESFVYYTLSKLDKNLPTIHKRQYIQRKKRYSDTATPNDGESGGLGSLSAAQIIDDVIQVLYQLGTKSSDY